MAVDTAISASSRLSCDSSAASPSAAAVTCRRGRRAGRRLQHGGLRTPGAATRASTVVSAESPIQPAATEPIASTISAIAMAGGASCRCDPDPCPCESGCPHGRVRASTHVRARRRRVVAPFTVERQEHQPEHVGRGQQRRERGDGPQDPVTVDSRLEQDLVLAEEAGQRRHAGNRDRRRSETSSR